MKVYFFTLGCKVNQYESQSLLENMRKNGYEITSSESSADIFVVNSCTVTANADHKTRQAVRHFKKINPDGLVVLLGCMPQAYKNQAEKLIEADIVTGNKNHDVILKLIDDYFSKKERIISIEDHKLNESFENCNITSFDERTRCFVKIQDGCDRYCSYCIIPYARGHSRSKSFEEIKSQFQTLNDSGFCEIVLVGINLCCYKDENEKTLLDVIKLANEFENFQRIRLGSLEFDNIDENFIDELSKIEKFCPQFHLSLQSGCDKTLKAMNRHYTTKEYSDLCKLIRKKFPDASITTDIMVGFPGETDKDFFESMEFTKTIGFEKVHVFPYSKRAGTKAYDMPQLENKVKEKRSKEMIDFTSKIRHDYLESKINTILEVLCEKKHDGYLLGYTKNYTPVKVISNEDLQGKTVKVKITEISDDYCIGGLFS